MQHVIRDRYETHADPGERASRWVEHLAPLYEVDLGSPREVASDVALNTYNLGDVLVGTVVAPRQRLTRSSRLVDHQGIDHVLLQFHTAGATEIVSGAKRSLVGARRVVAFDLAQPVVTDASPVRATNLVVPRKLLADRVGGIEDLHGRVFDYANDPAKRLLFTLLDQLNRDIETFGQQHLSGLCRAVIGLCQACLETDGDTHQARERLLKVEIRRHIEETVTDETLSVETITARFGVSRATLYRMFDLDGGVASFIRERRLLRGMRLLTRGGPSGRPRVSAVAYACGFSDEKSFSRAFRRRFGCLPSEAGLDLPHGWIGAAKRSVLMSWMQHLAG